MYNLICYVMLCYVTLRCFVMLCYVMLCYVMLCYVMSEENVFWQHHFTVLDTNILFKNI